MEDELEPSFLDQEIELPTPAPPPKEERAPKALVVEDDPDLSRVCSHALSRLGMRPQVVWTRDEALEILSKAGEPLAFAYVDARALRVKVSLPEGFVLDAAGSRLVAVAHSSEGTKRTELALDPLGTGPGKRGGGMWSSEVAVTSFEMDLTEDSVKALRELQREVATGKVKDVQLEVKVRLGAAPPGATSARLWVDLLMSPIEGYFPLIDGGTVAVERAKT